jgi:hypothetical protein
MPRIALRFLHKTKRFRLKDEASAPNPLVILTEELRDQL